jgi:hypothetical protein
MIGLTTPVPRKKYHIPQQASQGRRSTEGDRGYKDKTVVSRRKSRQLQRTPAAHGSRPLQSVIIVPTAGLLWYVASVRRHPIGLSSSAVPPRHMDPRNNLA